MYYRYIPEQYWSNVEMEQAIAYKVCSGCICLLLAEGKQYSRIVLPNGITTLVPLICLEPEKDQEAAQLMFDLQREQYVLL